MKENYIGYSEYFTANNGETVLRLRDSDTKAAFKIYRLTKKQLDLLDILEGLSDARIELATGARP